MGWDTVRSPWIVIGISIILMISALLRLFNMGITIPPITIACFSISAAIISVVDFIVLIKLRKGIQTLLLGVALIIFLFSFLMWIYPMNFDSEIAQTLGDGFTVLGIGIVILIFGIKETDYSKRKSEEKTSTMFAINSEFDITIKEYEEMLKLNDIIELLKKLTADTFSKNKVHDGWAIFSDSLVENWKRGYYPFYDGLNRKKYEEFILSLDEACGLMGEIADPDYYGKQNTIIKLWSEEFPISIQPAINSRYVKTVEDARIKLDIALSFWKTLKDGVIQRYEKERSEQ